VEIWGWANPDNTVTFTQHPANQTIIDGQTPAQLSVNFTATSGQGSAQYQWQRSDDGGTTWSNVGTSPTSYTSNNRHNYTPPALTRPANTGTAPSTVRFRCIVTVPPGKQFISNVATITVLPPTLRITKDGSNVITWWTNVPNYQLRSTNALPGGNGTNWTTETNGVVAGAGGYANNWVKTNDASSGTKIFELVK
jgi:hypothetical protein